ncbi:MAG: hypothetical protein AABW79_01965 [Nanoarchaeota archaeon]
MLRKGMAGESIGEPTTGWIYWLIFLILAIAAASYLIKILTT